MPKLLKSSDIAEMMGVSIDTARNYMRAMLHTEKPLRVSEAAFEAWLNQRTYRASSETAAAAEISSSAPDRIPRRRNGQYVMPGERIKKAR